ncbi:hypothetical protein [Peribacillus simplex]|uniref:hypothetical protein n=1 Tax=Peribacillus simplex TaxID=1478 RepID=UPI000970EED9|nr:hypothetical protein [Peribacillus simplex]
MQNNRWHVGQKLAISIGVGEHAPDIQEYIGSKTGSGTNCEQFIESIKKIFKKGEYEWRKNLK